MREGNVVEKTNNLSDSSEPMASQLNGYEPTLGVGNMGSIHQSKSMGECGLDVMALERQNEGQFDTEESKQWLITYFLIG